MIINFINYRKIAILNCLMLLVMSVFGQTNSQLEQGEESVLKIETIGVRTSFVLPNSMNAPLRVFDNQTEIKNFTVTKASDKNKLDLVIVLDFVPCQSRRECRDFYYVGEMISKNLKNLRYSEKPKVIVNSEYMQLEKIKQMINYSPKATDVSNFPVALKEAVNVLAASKNERQSILILTNRVNDLRTEEFMLLQHVMRDFHGFVEIITTKPPAPPKFKNWIGWNNLGLPGLIVSDNGVPGIVVDTQLTEYVQNANSLATISFQSEIEEPVRTVSIKTYDKVWGEQTRSRIYLTDGTKDPLLAELNSKSNCNGYFDEEFHLIEKSTNFVFSGGKNLLPIISKNLTDDEIYNNKVKESMQWLKTRHSWKQEFPFVVFKFDKPYIGIQDFNVIAYSTKALELLTPGEVAAVSAHEIAHLSLRNEPESEILEAKCDLIAWFVLPPELRGNLISAIRKMSLVEGVKIHFDPEQRINLLKNSLEKLDQAGEIPCRSDLELNQMAANLH